MAPYHYPLIVPRLETRVFSKARLCVVFLSFSLLRQLMQSRHTHTSSRRKGWPSVAQCLETVCQSEASLDLFERALGGRRREKQNNTKHRLLAPNKKNPFGEV